MRGANGGRNHAPLARLRAICMALPAAVEKTSHGEPSWCAGKGTMFAMLDNHHHGAAHVSVWLPAPLGAHLVADAYRLVAPPRLVTKLEAARREVVS